MGQGCKFMGQECETMDEWCEFMGQGCEYLGQRCGVKGFIPVRFFGVKNECTRGFRFSKGLTCPVHETLSSCAR
jgi:hypothetical protein